MKTFTSTISGKEFPLTERISAKSLRKSIFDLIEKDVVGFNQSSYLSMSEVNYYREKYVSEYLTKQIGELSDVEEKVIDSLTDRTTLTDKIEEDSETLTVGQRLADSVASFGGSWKFISIFIVIIVFWISFNAIWLLNNGFDPYPFILLNLILSCLAALQAPIIMMSQNRAQEKDRENATKDYMINLKSELEIRILHEKVDHLMMNQQQELMEIQKVQIEMMSDILQIIERRTKAR